MNILYLSRSNTGKPHPFIQEQANALVSNHNVNVDHFLIRSGGLLGYLKAAYQLKKYIAKSKLDIIHVHYGLSAIVPIIHNILTTEKYKLIITYHGSDINKRNERIISLLASKFSSHNILVSDKMLKYFKKNYSIVPCGIDTNVEIMEKNTCRKQFNISEEEFVILFSSSFTRKEKDPEFAFKVIEKLESEINQPIRFIELTGYNRVQVTTLMQAADVLIMCSKSEGSPQVIKEAILNSLPVISNDIGDVKSICMGIDNCYIIPKDIEAYVCQLKLISESLPRIKYHKKIIEKFDNNLISNKIHSIYTLVSNDN